MAGRFAGHVAVVTGGCSGIGAGIVRRLLDEGARVAVWDLAEAGPEVFGQMVEMTDPDAVQKAADATVATLGRLDILVASAGITGPNAVAWEYPIDAWKRVIDVNVNGVYYSNRAVVPHMLAGGWGRIVNVASIAGKEGNPNAAAYSASKAAVIGLTKSLGKELASSAVRVNCVTPAAVQTPLFDQMSPSQIDFMLSKIPMGRFGLIEEVAAMVCWLASAEASFSTGAVFDCSGGRATY
jgi:3-oxoacyl-[acyl-carrier protein] reductase